MHIYELICIYIYAGVFPSYSLTGTHKKNFLVASRDAPKKNLYDVKELFMVFYINKVKLSNIHVLFSKNH
jgi:hypothetical protein